MKKQLALIAVFLCVALASAQDNYTAWTYHKNVILNTQASGAGVMNNVLNFPVLVRLAAKDSLIFKQAAHNGVDVRFSKSNLALHVSYQIERWDSAHANAAIWVLVDTVKGNINNQVIRMHWGKSGAADSSNGKVVFDTANGFQAVFHMNKGDTTSETDATANAFTANEFNQPVDSAGVIGRARYFNGTNQRFQIANSASSTLNFQMTDSYTLSTWMLPVAVSTTANDGNKIIDKGDNQYVLADYSGAASPKYWEITTRGNNAYNQCTTDPAVTAGVTVITTVGSDVTLAAGGWHHLVGTYHGAAVGGAIAESLYYDGALIVTWAGTNTNNTGRVLTFNVNFGAQGAGTAPNGSTFTRFWNGLLDEVRLANRSRSHDWVTLEYANEKSAQTLVTLSDTIPTLAVSQSIAPKSFGVWTTNSSMVFQIPAGTPGAKVTVMDIWGRVVWAQTIGNGARELTWNGYGARGRVSAGIYLVRLNLLNGQNQTSQVLERKILFAR